MRDEQQARVATFAAVFLAGGVMFTLTVLIGLYVQDIMGYSALKAGIGFIPFVIALGIGLGLSSQLVAMFSPRVLVIAGGMAKGQTFDDLVIESGGRLRAAILLGVDREIIGRALRRHAPDVPVIGKVSDVLQYV